MGSLQTFDRYETALPGVCLLQPRVLQDSRGSFLESYHEAKFADLGINDRFVQDNHSCSRKNVLRGLHYQLNHAQAKLCRVVEGEALDVAVDIRVDSPHFGKWMSAILSAKTQNMIYVPSGFAHGFLALTDPVQFLYKCSDIYNAADERGILWCDPGLGISWGVANPLLAERDSKWPVLADTPRELLPRFSGR